MKRRDRDHIDDLIAQAERDLRDGNMESARARAAVATAHTSRYLAYCAAGVVELADQAQRQLGNTLRQVLHDLGR